MYLTNHSRLPRSADPSPQRHSNHLENRLETLRRLSQDGGKSNQPQIQHQVLYVCHGHCSGPECEFTQSIRQWQSMVMLQGDDMQCSSFQSEVVAEAEMPQNSFCDLDEKRRSLMQMKAVLQGKLESKQRHRKKNKKKEESKTRQISAEVPKSITTAVDRKVEKDSKLTEQDIGEVIRTRHQQRPRALSSGQNDFETSKAIRRNSVLDISAQDLLCKSHEELVLLLIRLRRQSTTLNETIAGYRLKCKAAGEAGKLRELEEQRARTQPVVSLVDNMVKLGSLYRGPQEAPLSHRIRNLPAKIAETELVTSPPQKVKTSLTDEEAELMTEQRKADIQVRLLELYHIEVEFKEEELNVKYLLDEKNLLDCSLDQVKQAIHLQLNECDKADDVHIKQEQMLENELMRIKGQLELSQKKLDDNAGEHSRWEHDLLFLRQQLQQAASRDMQHGLDRSAETLAIEGELAQVQARAAELHGERQLLAKAAAGHIASENRNFPSWRQTELGKEEDTEMDMCKVDRTEMTLPFQDHDKRSVKIESAIEHGNPSPTSFTRHDRIIEGPHSSGERGQFLARNNFNGDSGMTARKETSKTNFMAVNHTKKGETKNSERPVSSRSAHERLFGTATPVKLNSSVTSTPMSPGKTGAMVPNMGNYFGTLFKFAPVRQLTQGLDEKKASSEEDGKEIMFQALIDYEAKAAGDTVYHHVNALRPKTNAPDVIKSALDKKDTRISTNIIDKLLGAPEKINIPERYIPDSDMSNETIEEREVRMKKADRIRKMLADTSGVLMDEEVNLRRSYVGPSSSSQGKKEREHLLALNQIIAHQVMEKSKMVAVRALANQRLSYNEDLIKTGEKDVDPEVDDDSPSQPLPLFQQRESILS